jgi:hypothetical protein
MKIDDGGEIISLYTYKECFRKKLHKMMTARNFEFMPVECEVVDICS